MKRYKVRLFWKAFGIVLIPFIACGHANLAISNYGIPILFVILCGLFEWGNKKKKILNSYNILFLSFIVALIFSFLISNNDFNSGYFITYFIYACLGFLVSSIKIEDKDFFFLINCYVTSASIMSLFMIFNPANYMGRGSTRFYEGPIFEVNYLAFYLFGAILLLLYRLIEKEALNNVTRNIYIVLLVLNVYTMFLTGSRNTMAGLVVFVLGIVVRSLRIKRISYNQIIKWSLIVIVGVFIGGVILERYVPQEIVERLFVSQIMDQSNMSRISHWKFALETIAERPFMGYGVSTTVKAIANATGNTAASHNSFLSIWINTGFIGIVTVLGVYFFIVRSAIKNHRYTLMAMVLALLFTQFMVDFDIIITFWFMMFFAIKESSRKKCVEKIIGEEKNEK